MVNNNPFSEIKTAASVIFKKIDKLVGTKFTNASGKTVKGDVPTKLWLERTPRHSRFLISWKTILENDLELKHLETSEGGVCVEFVNDDFLQSEHPPKKNKLYKELKSRIGSDENVSAMICFRTADKDPGANSARAAYENFNKSPKKILLNPIKKLDNDTYKNRYKMNFKKEYKHKQNKRPAKENWAWEGNSFWDIRGGKAEKFLSHEKKQALFNPAIEYATEKCSDDIYAVLVFFFLHAKDLDKCASLKEIDDLKQKCSAFLKTRDYDDGNLYQYCVDHDCLTYKPGVLMDPIEVLEINAKDFALERTESDEMVLDLAHNEAQSHNIIKFDKTNKFLVTAARPTNLFWAKKSSNMLQQDHLLKDFYQLERGRVKRRDKLG